MWDQKGCSFYVREHTSNDRLMCIGAAESKVSSHLQGILQQISCGPPPTLSVQLCLCVHASLCHLLAPIVVMYKVRFCLALVVVYLFIPLLGQVKCFYVFVQRAWVYVYG